MRYLAVILLLASTAAFADEDRQKLNCEPDQSGKLTACWRGTPPPYPCDWKKSYCPAPSAPVGYGY